MKSTIFEFAVKKWANRVCVVAQSAAINITPAGTPLYMSVCICICVFVSGVAQEKQPIIPHLLPLLSMCIRICVFVHLYLPLLSMLLRKQSSQ